MAPSNRPSSLSSLLSRVVDDLGLKERLKDTEVEEVWREVAGPQVARVTSKARMQGDRLIVYLQDATWRHALFAEREAWRRRLNEAVGREAVSEIVFR